MKKDARGGGGGALCSIEFSICSVFTTCFIFGGCEVGVGAVVNVRAL